MLARSRQARVIIVNQGPTYMDDHCDVLIREDVAVALPAIAARCLSGFAADRSGST
jgi:NAD-dependent SIR2 family protein deacetylase